MKKKTIRLIQPVMRILILSLVVTACAPVTPITIPPTPSAPSPSPEPTKPPYLDKLTFGPEQANYYDLIDTTFELSAAEISLLRQNGFVVTDRLAFEDFTQAYAYIYWKDLPVLITTDSILHAIHVTYDDLLSETEILILTPRLIQLLSESRKQLNAAASVNTDPELAPLYKDLEIYLSVPLALLDPEQTEIPPEAAAYVDLAQAAARPTQVSLFGAQRTVDFTLFKPRGHYTQLEELEQYFRAMSWLAQIDFRLVQYDPSGQPTLNLSDLAAATLLLQTVDAAYQRSTWDQMYSLIGTFVGPSDNTTIPDLERFVTDAGVAGPEDVIRSTDPAVFLALLTSNQYGQQHITGQVLFSNTKISTPRPRDIGFALFGQSFTVDSYVMSNLSFDRLVVDGKKVQRAFPSTMDVMYTLGNDRAKTHLQTELARYHYESNLEELRQTVNGFAPDFWTSSTHNRWLDMLRTLNIDTSEAPYPQAMQTAAWADKTLHTQLASWAQLRRDNILYAKQSVSGFPLCSYPAGYVEPYPLFYGKVEAYAQAGGRLFRSIYPNDLGFQAQDMRSTAIGYFDNLEIVAGRLQSMAEKELRQEAFSKEEEAFLKNTAVRQVESFDTVCAGIMSIEEWRGWYPNLFPWKDTSPAVVADVHTNLNTDSKYPDLLPPGVLHVATGSVSALLFVVDTDEGPCMYVGPSFTFYEAVVEGYPPTRLTDEAWQERLNTDPAPPLPEWTKDFRLPSFHPPVYLSWPTE